MSNIDINSVPVNFLKKIVQTQNIKFFISGNSMEPTYFDGDEVYVEYVDKIDIGDIICFYNQKKYVIHRVVCNRNGLILTKGDNNKYIDSYNPNVEIIGRVKKNEKKNEIINVVYIFWNKDEYDTCKNIGDKLGLEMICNNCIPTDGYNIAISPYSMDGIRNEMINKQKVYIHIGAKISDFNQEGFVLDSDFDKVVRGGSYQSMLTLSAEEKFVILANQIEMLMEEN